MQQKRLLLATLLFLALNVGQLSFGMETVTYQMTPLPKSSYQPPVETVTGQVIAKVSDGGMIFETDEGAMLFLRGKEIKETKSDDRPFAPVTPEVLGERLLASLPARYRIHETKHYVIAYDTSREYAEWSSSLLERLNKALVAYWKKKKMDLVDPRFPLPIIIHSSFKDYQIAGKKDGVGAGAVGYYNLRNNRVRMYDITGSDEFRSSGKLRSGSRREITQMLSTPEAEPLVATIIHEATHQVCYNTGIMQRFADLPIWYVEGMAVYFEAPDASSSRGWRGIGKVNYRRLDTFHRNLDSYWNDNSLRSLIASDQRLRDPRTGGNAYADAWALNYYLLKRKPKQYVAFVKELAERKPFIPASKGGPKVEAARRIALFEKHFGKIDKVSREMVNYITRI